MDLIGSGGEGNVYKSFDPQLNRIIAHKAIPIASFSRIDEFFEEARKVFLSKHHNVVEIYYGCRTVDSICLAMPFFEKGSLKKLLDTRNITEKEVIRYSLQFLSGLNNIHSKRVFHFDLKPENVLISDSNVAVISDFGLARHVGRSGTVPTGGVTPNMMPPEYYVLGAQTERFDVYQAGLTMYRMCNSEKRFQEQEQRVTHGATDPRRALKDAIEAGIFPDRDFFLPHVSLSLRKIIKRALELNPNDRYATVFDMLNDLCKIDKTHDWALADTATGEEWTRRGDVVTATLNGVRWDVVAKRNGRRNNTYCAVGLDKSHKHSLLARCFKEWNEE